MSKSDAKNNTEKNVANGKNDSGTRDDQGKWHFITNLFSMHFSCK